MRPELYERATRLFRAALALDPGERASFLAEECGEEGDLQHTVTGMLRADAAFESEDAELCVRSDVDVAPVAFLDRVDSDLPDRIGPYQVLGEIARGGMGVVVEAQQSSPHRRVALKILTGADHDPEGWRRLEREAEALGRLRHPNIAQIFEAGIHDDGRSRFPFIAMERVEGQPVDEYLEETAPSVVGRVELLLEIARAVEHAHQRGVVHRDLKPGNVLVDTHGRPKVLDFGIARLTHGESRDIDRTLAGQVLGSLEFMAPEQASGNPESVDTRADVFGLAALGFAMLTGEPPLSLRGLPMATALVRVAKDERRGLDDIDPSLADDLARVMGHALELNPDNRYASVSEFVSDLRRTLTHEPVTVRRPTSVYLLRKFARRHRALVVTGSIVVTALVGGLIFSLLFLDRALEAERLAQRRLLAEQAARERTQLEADRAVRTTELLQDLLFDADPTQDVDGGLTVRVLLGRFAEDLDQLEDPSVEAALRYTIGRAFYGLGRHREAVHNLRLSVSLHEVTFGAEDVATLNARSAFAAALRANGDLAEAEAHYRESAAGLERLLGATAPETISALNNLAVFLYARQDLEGARDVLSELYRRSALAQGADDEKTLSAAHNLAAVYLALSRVEDATELLQETVKRRLRVLGPDDPRTLKSRGMLAGCLQRTGRHEEACAEFQRLVAQQVSTVGNEHPDTNGNRHNAAKSLLALGRADEAVKLEREAWTILERERGTTHPLTLRFRAGLAAALRESGDLAASLTHYEETLRLRTERDGVDAASTRQVRREFANTLREQGGDVSLRRALALFRANGDTEEVDALTELLRRRKSE